jgi:alcohol dehydrogenase class IV
LYCQKIHEYNNYGGVMGLKKAYCRTYQWIFNIAMKAVPWREPVRVEGVDSFHSIPEILEQAEKWSPMIVTGPRVGKSGFLKTLYGELSERTVIYDQVHPDPTISQIEEMVSLYHKNECDSIIAIGGGSNMDAAKALAARIARPDKSLKAMGGQLKVGRETPFMIAVPTTAGTGSETTIAAVVTDDVEHHKYAINDVCLVPDYAVMDPSLTTSLPQDITAATGMDALTHAVEAYLNWTYHTEDTLENCEEAVCGIMEFLLQAYERGDSLEAREEMLIASFKAGAAFTRACVGNVHAIAHGIGGLYHVPHGLANAVVLPIVLEDYGSAIYGKLSRLATLSQVATEGTEEERAKAFITHIREMNEHMGIPVHLPQIQEEDIPKMAAWAEKEANPLYPVPVIYSKGHFEEVIRKVSGK